MKKKAAKSKLSLNKNVISKLGAASIKGGGPGNGPEVSPVSVPTHTALCGITYTAFCIDTV